MNQELKFLNAFNGIPTVGPAALRLLKQKFGTYEEAWSASDAYLKEAGISSEAAHAISWKRPSINPNRELEKLVKEEVWMIAETDEHYPAALKEISYPPVVLYGKGSMPLFKKNVPALGVVGTRRPTNYGLEVTEGIVQELVRAGVLIVSGLATGIDARAHETAVSEKGATIAVLGSGLDQNSVFPPENRGLAHRIAAAGGIVLSEYAHGTPALKEHFPQRNRIIAGLSRGVLVVEARERSGALITARFALEENREVFAVPGSVFSATSKGPHKLLQEGAKLVQSAEDILDELGLEYTKEQAKYYQTELLGEHERLILEMLEEPLGVDLLKEKTGLATPLIVTSLSSLELRGIIKNIGQDVYQKII